MAMENYSLSDIAAASGNDGGMGGCNSWVLIILFALIFGGGAFGFGNGNTNAAVTESAMCNMNNFQQLENAVGRLNDAQAQQNMMISNGMCNLGYQNLEQFGSLQRDLCTGFANGVAATNNAAAQARECCCETNRNIDQLRYDSAMNTAAINANISEKFAALEKNQLQQTIDAQQNQINQLYINSQLCGVVRYPNGMTYNAGNSPFCGGGCCGNI